MTVLVSLSDAAAWVGLAPKVVLSALKLNGIPFIWLNSDNDGSDNEYFLEIDLDFAIEVGLPVVMIVPSNPPGSQVRGPGTGLFLSPRQAGERWDTRLDFLGGDYRVAYR